MATMMKEKRREKKKTKEKKLSKSIIESEQPPIVKELTLTEHECSVLENDEIIDETSKHSPNVIHNIENPIAIERTIQEQVSLETCTDPLEIPSCSKNENETQSNLKNTNLYETLEEIVTPSAPVFEEEEVPQTHSHVNVTEKINIQKPKVQCMPLEEAIKLYGGAEMAEIVAMSEREEALVVAGPVSGPEHPLVDLLSTFRCSLIAMERERIQLARGYSQEEMSRAALWKVEKRKAYMSEDCSCGTSVTLQATYECAELLTNKLPVAKMRLESLLRDVQDSFCHHQHAALLAHCQIEELISETVQANKNIVREALTLILQELRLSNDAPAALAAALQRWAIALTAVLLDGRDLRQLLFLLHHLFRQTRSVHWAARLIHVTVGDNVEAARAIALLELLLTRQRLEPAVECTEDTEEVWEEVDRHGGGCAVSDGALRERDLLALLKTFSMRDLVARLVLFTHSDVKLAREHEWCDRTYGRGALKAACGVRTLLSVFRRAGDTHAQYTRLKRALRARAIAVLMALAALHRHNRSSYSRELVEKVDAEMEASFALGFTVLKEHELYKLPSTLLRDDTAKDYCFSFIVNMHEKSPKPIETLSMEMPVLPCSVRVRIIAQVAADRNDDHELARIILDILFQTGIKRKPSPCKGGCEAAARDYLPLVLDAHPYLYTTALHILADLNEAETLEPCSVKCVGINKWRPSCADVLAVLEDWSRRCPLLLQHLLLQLDYTPHVGMSLECQLAIGSWLCGWVQQTPNTEPPEWTWSVLRRLRVHRINWTLPLDAPSPDQEPKDTFSSAYAVLSSSWGHCIPLVCERGVVALRRVAGVRVREAVHCLSLVAMVMAQSPESVSLTPGFSELFSVLLGSGPSLMQRALGRGGVSGTTLLQRLLLEQFTKERCGGVARSGLLSVWLHGLWNASLPPPALQLLDTAVLACREWTQLDRHAAVVMQEENAKDYIQYVVRNAHIAPLVCESVLRAAHAHRELRPGAYAALLAALAGQRAAAHKIHVDNALKQTGSNMSSEELVIYRLAEAVLVVPLQHPSHLTLWTTFFHLYLQKPITNQQDFPPVGCLFFSGLIKTRTLNRLKRRLQDTATYHHNESETLKTGTSGSTDKEPSANRIVKSSSTTIDDNFLPALSINDLTGESSESEDSDSSESSDYSTEGERDSNIEDTKNASGVKKKDILNLIRYHMTAEKMVREYLRWLEDGEKVRAEPHHADIARFIPELALEAAWERELQRNRPPTSPEDEDFPLPSEAPPQMPEPSATPFQSVISTILSMRSSSNRSSRRFITKSPLQEVNFNDYRTLLSLVDKLLKDIELLAREWSSEVSRVSTLDSRLWQLVAALRVRSPLRPVTKYCPQKCKPIVFVINAYEWCISTAAEQGIRENRSCARTAVRRLARARPHAASAAASLATIARRINSREAGTSVVQRAWRCACAVQGCAPAHLALTALVTDLAERWVCHDGKLCADLLSRWCERDGDVQRALRGALVAPRRLPPEQWPLVYTTILNSPLPSHTVFSYLSKFEMSRWSAVAERPWRREVLDALHAAAQRWGSAPHHEHHVLLELIGVHSSTLIDGYELGGACARFARSCVAGALPPTQLLHLQRAAAAHAPTLPLDQLGHILRELGVIWWEARTGVKVTKEATKYSAYALYMAQLLHTLQRAFVSVAVQLSYTPERVSLYAWSSLQESWAAWVSPHPAAPPLLPSTGDGNADLYTAMIKRFVDNIHQIMLDCAGSEEYLLQHVWEWTIHSYLTVRNSPTSHECRVQMSDLLAELAKLPWNEHQWFSEKCLQNLLQVTAVTDREISSWCCDALRGVSVTAESLLRDVTEEQLAQRLAVLLHVFTSSSMPVHQQTLDELTRLPWWCLPEAALDPALERYFIMHHNPLQPFHVAPQFRLVLYASELCLHAGAFKRGVPTARNKRTCAAAHWLRAVCAPALHAHVATHVAYMLDTITNIVPYLDESEGELEDLLGRVAIILCMEPAAAIALPVWERWVGGAPCALRRACAAAVCVVTAFERFAALADAAARALLAHNESAGWCEVRERWRRCHWREAGALVGGGRLHAGYGVALAHRPPPHALRTALQALIAPTIDFVENECIAALWVCYSCRVARTCSAEGAEGAECAAGARALLARWGQEPRHALLRVVTLQTTTDKPTAKVRLLCRLAQCILTPDCESAVRAYEASCTAVLGANADASTWGKAPHPKRLPRLAMRLFPDTEKYFKEELDLAPEDST